jgi:hypothetical protein
MSTTEIEVQARELGWRPQTEFKGKEADFVDAETFVKRGKEIMPLLKKNNQRLEGELTRAQQELKDLRAAVADGATAVEELKKFNTEMTRQAAEAAKAELLAQLKQAKKDGNTDLEVELTDQLSETSAALREAKKAPTGEERRQEQKPNGGDKPGPDAAAAKIEFDSWKTDNDWYGKDDIKTGVANGIAAKLRRENSPLVGVDFYKEVSKQTEAFMDKDRPNPNKVESGGRSNGGGSGGQGSGKLYQDMPQAAQDACERFMKRDITIGKGKTFETPEAFRKYYAETYFARSE